MAKIAVEFEQRVAGRARGQAPGHPARRLLARGEGWSVSHVICSAGPHQRPFEEQHSDVCVAIVVAGSFQYRSSAGGELMTPGSLLLGNPGQYFECRHDHGVGDRCISFSYQPRYMENLQAEVGIRSRKLGFSLLRVPPVRDLSRLVVRACTLLAESRERGDGEQSTFAAQPKTTTDSIKPPGRSNAAKAEWEEIGMELAARALELASSGEPNRKSLPAAEARVSRVVRMIEDCPALDHPLDLLAREARLSRYHFLRIFQELTGLTPHRYVLRTRLRHAAARLILEPARVLDIALDAGFGDVSNFNHCFRAEFGLNPRSYRRNAHRSNGEKSPDLPLSGRL